MTELGARAGADWAYLGLALLREVWRMNNKNKDSLAFAGMTAGLDIIERERSIKGRGGIVDGSETGKRQG